MTVGRELELLWRRGRRLALGAGLASLLLALLDPDSFFQGWLVAFLFWLALGLGSLGLVMLHHLTGGAWGMAIRRLLEGGLRTLPLLALLALPLVLSAVTGLGHLYEWADPAAAASDPLLAHKAPYLNPTFFTLRAVGYFALWIGLSWALLRWARQQDRSGDPRLSGRMRALSGPGIVLYGLAVTFAAIDWGMSIEPHQFSTIYGARLVVGQALSTLALAIVLAARLARKQPFARFLSTSQFHDLGKLLFAFVMLWAYMAFSDFLIIWSGDLAEETPFYLRRMHGIWGATAVVLILFHFFLPFGLLLSRTTKRNPRVLGTVAAGILLLRAVDYYWLILPGFEHKGWLVWVQTPLLLLALGGLWLSRLAAGLRGRPLISLQGAHLESALEGLPSEP